MTQIQRIGSLREILIRREGQAMTEYALLAAIVAAALYLFIEGAPQALGLYFRPFAVILTLPLP